MHEMEADFWDMVPREDVIWADHACSVISTLYSDYMNTPTLCLVNSANTDIWAGGWLS